MNAGYRRLLTIVAAVGSGVAAGFFFAFSVVVMKALGRLPAAQGLRAMQEINKAAERPWLLIELFGTAVVCVALVIVALRRRSEPASPYLLIGSALYLSGVVLTIAYHVPKNDDLALVDPRSSGAAAAWNDYRGAWTAWNHVRTLTSLAATVVFVVALVASARTRKSEPSGVTSPRSDLAANGVLR